MRKSETLLANMTASLPINPQDLKEEPLELPCSITNEIKAEPETTQALSEHCEAPSTSDNNSPLTSEPPREPLIKVKPPSALQFYPPSRRTHSKSAPAMGVTESKPSETKLTSLFEQYKDENEDCILAEGIEQLCQDLQVSPDDFKVLVLAWKLNAEQMCRFTRLEFVDGLKAARADSIKSIQSRLPELTAFTFRFGFGTASGQRILPRDMAIVLWRLVFTIRELPILNRWLNFLETHQMIRGIPKDTWNMFLNFSEHVGNDLSCYDDNEAWPSLFDDFVEYENDQANQNISKDKEKECDELLITQE
ncbi:hypothetical protein NQ317_011641 [Molorchus minor]|uniref:Defective in cullin neddylation protein n=1 Tax=Molorchus minor TaxID=1323400 RepID=A0ABQ9JBH9_9CUCU|nr:hypothetical protein NQ317_011641 [Molorchus minor]